MFTAEPKLSVSEAEWVFEGTVYLPLGPLTFIQKVLLERLEVETRMWVAENVEATQESFLEKPIAGEHESK